MGKQAKGIENPKMGMNRDAHESTLSAQEYSFMLNGNYQDEHGNGVVMLQNEGSNIKCTGFKTGYKVIGHKFDINGERTYFFLVNPTTNISEIGYINSFHNYTSLTQVESACECNITVVLENGLENTTQTNTCSYYTLVSDYCELTSTATRVLNFNIDYPIFENNIHIKSETVGKVIYFTDNLNPSRYIKLDYLDTYTQDIDLCTGDVTETCLDVDKMRVDKLFEHPCVQIDSIKDGGNLKAGMYEVAIAYSDASGNIISEYFSMTNPLAIHDRNNNILDQTNLDYITNKSFKVNITGLDLDYRNYTLSVIHRSGLDGAVEYFKYGTYPTDVNTIIVASLTNSIRTTVEDINQIKTFYKKSKGLAQSNGYLFHYGLETQKELNLQPIANLLGSFAKWGTMQANEDLYMDGANISNFKTAMRDEVYPYSIRFSMKGGYHTPNFVLIPRPPTASELEVIDNLNSQSILAYTSLCEGGDRTLRWQFENTATVDEGVCVVPPYADTETVIRPVESSCIVYDGASIKELGIVASGVVYVETNLPIAVYVNQNIAAIIASVDPQWVDIQTAISDASTAVDHCTPDYGDNCDTAVLEVEEAIAIGTTAEVVVQEAFPFADYDRVLAPTTCNSVLLDGGGAPVSDTVFETTYMKSGEIVYTRGTLPTNIACTSAIVLTTWTNPQVDVKYYLDNKGVVGALSGLQTTITAQNYTDYSTKLHTNALWYKFNFTGPEKVIVELSPILCNFSDDNSGTSIRISVYDTCASTTDIASYSRVVSDVTLVGDTNKFVELDPTDFSGTTGYIVIDSPIRGSEEFTITLSGTTGTANILIVATNYLVTFATDLTTTAANFVTTHAAAILSAHDIIVTSALGVITFRGPTSLEPGVGITNVTGDLAGTKATVQTYYTLTPPCGCFNIYQREQQTLNKITFTNLSFGKRETYTSSCTFSIPKLGNCDPIPYKKGNFSYWESLDKYTCNSELFDSSSLVINQSDIPVGRQTEFEDNYVTAVGGGGAYTLSAGTNFMDTNIRHYKYPDSKIAPYMSYENGVDPSQNPGDFKESVIYPIGFNLSVDVINAFLDIAVNNNLLTLEDRLNITKYEIFRGDRRYNKSVVAKGVLFDMYESNGVQKELYSNYPLNTLGGDPRNGSSQNHLYGSTSNNLFTFHSPTTHFHKPTLPSELSVEGYIFGKGQLSYDEVKNHPTYILLGSDAYALATSLAIAESLLEVLVQSSDWGVLAGSGGVSAPAASIIAGIAIAGYVIAAIYKTGQYRLQWIQIITNLGKPENFAYYQTAVGYYNYFIPNSVTDSTLRGISNTTYLREGLWNLKNELTGVNNRVNNKDREDSVFIGLGAAPTYNIKYPSVYSNYDNFDISTTTSSRRGYGGVGRSHGIDPYSGNPLISNTALPYVALKQYLPSQYGQIDSISWMSTGFCGDLSSTSDCDIALGGDVFISRFAIKRKFPFFTTDAFGLAPLTPFAYSKYFNINPEDSTGRKYIDYQINDTDNYVAMFVWPSNKSDYDLEYLTGDDKMYVKPPSKFYLYSYGLPHFLVESEINCNYRYGKREDHENFYPNVGDVMEWTQEKNVSIREPNTYFYNDVYSALHSSVPYRVLPSNYSKEVYDKLSNLPNAVRYSGQDVSENGLLDPWLMYKPLDAYQFPINNGTLTEMDGIESGQVLARFTNGLSIFGAVDVLKDRLTPEIKNLGIGGIFTGRSINFNNTQLGYGGAQHNAKVSCDFGHFWADAKRGKVFSLQPGGSGLKEITKGLEKWFKENLPFKILRTFPTVNVDNNFKGLGLAIGWDDRLKRLFITKKDYTIINEDLAYEDGIGFYVESPCPEGYTLVGNVCTKVTLTPKEPVGTPVVVDYAGSTAYGFHQPTLYSAYNSNGSGNVDGMSPTGYTFEHLTDLFWTGNGVVVDRLVNKLAKWSGSFGYNIWYGATSIINVVTPKTYYVVLTADNQFRFSVDGGVILTSDHTVISPQHGYLSGNDTTTFKRVHIYPIELTEGCHTVKIEGKNFGSLGMFGAAILDNTDVELRNATSTTDLNFIYSTETERYFYEDALTYECQEGYVDLTPSSICGDCSLTETTYGITLVELGDPTYFRECSWTVAYSPVTEGWVSYYSFKPNYYIGYHNYFQTGINYSSDSTELGLWSHLPFVSSYQVFYGKLYPWTIDYSLQTKYTGSVLNGISYYLDARKYYSEWDYTDGFGIGFNKAIVYNNTQNSGQLNLVFQQNNNLRQQIDYPQYNPTSVSILQSEIDGKFSFNYLYNLIKNEKSGLPIFINNCSQTDKTIDNRLLDYRNMHRDRLRGDYLNVRLSNDIESKYKMIFRFGMDDRTFYE